MNKLALLELGAKLGWGEIWILGWNINQRNPYPKMEHVVWESAHLTRNVLRYVQILTVGFFARCYYWGRSVGLFYNIGTFPTLSSITLNSRPKPTCPHFVFKEMLVSREFYPLETLYYRILWKDMVGTSVCASNFSRISIGVYSTITHTLNLCWK